MLSVNIQIKALLHHFDVLRLESSYSAKQLLGLWTGLNLKCQMSDLVTYFVGEEARLLRSTYNISIQLCFIYLFIYLFIKKCACPEQSLQ